MGSFILGIAGGSGSGKTTFVEQLLKRLANLPSLIIPLDWYYLDRSHLTPAQRQDINYDAPEAFEVELLCQHLTDLRLGKTVDIPIYDFKSHSRSGLKKASPQPLIVIEGIYSLYFEALRDLCDLEVFLEVDDDIRLARRIERDILSRGRELDDVLRQYQESVKPMHDRYSNISRQRADIIFSNWGFDNRGLDMLASYIQTKLASE